jgi:hypothetical protein
MTSNISSNSVDYTSSEYYDMLHTIHTIPETFKEIKPIILSEINDNMVFVKNITFVIQTPAPGLAYAPNYISAGPQTHFAIYKNNNNKLNLIHTALLIVYDGCSAYLIEKNIKYVFKQYGLNNSDIEILQKNKYEFQTDK